MNNERVLMSYESVFNKISINRSQELFFSNKKKEAKQSHYRPDFNTVKKLTNDAAKIFKEVLKSFNNPKGFKIDKYRIEETLEEFKNNEIDFINIGRSNAWDYVNNPRNEEEYNKYVNMLNKITKKLVEITNEKTTPYRFSSDGGDWDGTFFSITFIDPKSINRSDKSSESFNKKYEQNDINSRKSSLFSIEDDDPGSFEEAAGGDDQGGNDQQSNPNEGAVQEPEMSSMDGGGDDGGWGDDSGGGDDSGWGDDGNGDDSGNDENGGNENNNKKNVFDSNIGSSMNPFTQINQKLYQLETLNELRSSIKRTVDLYNAQYADWSEVCQLKELLKILDEERKSFMMQQNPENLLKLGLYQKQYDNLVQNISKRISKLAANDRQ